METENQIAHKAYLTTDHWKSKRLAVLEQRGCKCEKCGEWGNEIHHLTYENLWNEPLTDLQVLCRDCHEATHRALKCVKISQGKKNARTDNLDISRGALAYAISFKQLEVVAKNSNEWDGVGLFRNETPETVLDIIRESWEEEDFPVITRAARLLGFKDFYPKKLRQKRKDFRPDPYKNEHLRRPLKLF